MTCIYQHKSVSVIFWRLLDVNTDAYNHITVSWTKTYFNCFFKKIWSRLFLILMLNFEICFCFHFTKCDGQSEPWFDGPIQRWLEYLYYNCTAFQILNIKLLNADVSISFVLWRYNCCNKTCLLFTFCYHICINCDRFWEYLINFNPPFKDSTILH